MQECPRCGFMQPKDRFCANCGLDIENYHPAPQPLLKRVFKSTWFTMTFIAFLLGSLVFTVFYFKSNYTKSTTEEIVATQTYSSSVEEEADVDSYDNEAASRPQEDAQSLMAEPAPQNMNVAASKPIEQPPTPKEEVKTFNRIKGQFGLIEISKLETITSQAALIDQNQQAQVYLLKNKSVLNEFTTQHNYNTQIDTPNAPKEYVNLIEIPGVEEQIGFMLRITPSNKTKTSVSLRTQTQLILRDSDNLQEPKLFEHEFLLQMNHEQLILIIGVLPHEKIPEMDLEYFNSGFISLYQEPSFNDKTAESVIVLELAE